MCGRFSLFTQTSVICDYFNIEHISELPPRYNIAPTQNVLIIRHNAANQREGAMARWGLVPHWMSEEKISSALINARVETAITKPSFRNAFKKHRCLVVADGFYEWQTRTGQSHKQPYYFSLPNKQPIAFAGLWEHWQHRDHIIESCTILTTEANDQVRDFHQRMPIILAPDDFDFWLERNTTHPQQYQEFISHTVNPTLDIRAVSTKVNNPRYDAPDCIAS